MYCVHSLGSEGKTHFVFYLETLGFDQNIKRTRKFRRICGRKISMGDSQISKCSPKRTPGKMVFRRVRKKIYWTKTLEVTTRLATLILTTCIDPRDRLVNTWVPGPAA